MVVCIKQKGSFLVNEQGEGESHKTFFLLYTPYTDNVPEFRRESSGLGNKLNWRWVFDGQRSTIVFDLWCIPIENIQDGSNCCTVSSRSMNIKQQNQRLEFIIYIANMTICFISH